MKLLNIKTIQAKIVIFTGIPILVIMAVLVTLSAISSFQMASRSADQQAYSDAQYQAARIKAQIEVPLDMSRSLAQALAVTQSGGEGTALTRAQVNKMLYNILTENPDFLGIWTVWEPNAFDGKDAEYQNTDGNDQTGRFIPYWVRGENNAIYYEPVVDYDTLDFYQCPKKTGVECVIDPYNYQIEGRPVSLTTVSVPVISGGKFLGVVGVDMNIHDLQQWADEYSGFNNLAQMRVVSNHGTFAAVKGEAPTALDSIENNKVYEDISSVLTRIQRQETFHTDRDQTLSFFSPITFGSTTTPWALNVVVPKGIIYQEATRAMWSQILTGSVFAAIGLLAIWLLSLQFSRPIVRLTGVANQVVAGKLDLYADIQTTDEIGVLANAFNNMISQVREMLEKERSQRQYLEETVQKYVAYLNDVARGNLVRRVQINGNGHSEQDPLVQLGHNLNDMTASLQKMIGQIREASSNLSTASTEIMAATTQQASGTSEQSASIAQTTTTVDEVKVIAEQSRTRAHEVTRTAQRTVEVAHVGQQAVHDTINSMNEIRGRVEGIAENILSLSEQTQMIGEIIATVNEIASQSNMLALNASVEAARAGEHGKGFSVVAMEVRALAEQSKAATAQIKEILSEIQKATNATVMATEEGTKGVDRGVLMAVKAQEAIEQLAQVINETSKASTQMSAGAQQQMSGVEQVAMAMQNINQATIQNLASTRQAEKAAQNLNELARHLNEMVTLYQI